MIGNRGANRAVAPHSRARITTHPGFGTLRSWANARGDDAAAVDALTRGIAACPGSWSGILRAELPAFDMRARAVHDARDMGLGADVSSGSGTIQAPG